MQYFCDVPPSGRTVVIADTFGRLGNMMFAYAYLLALRERGDTVYWNVVDSKRKKIITDAFPDVEFEILPEPAASDVNFRVPHGGWEVPVRIDGVHGIPFKTEEYITDTMFPEYSCALIAYYMSEKYFGHIAPTVREAFTFDYHDLALTRRINRLEDEPASVAVHVRRADYIDPERAYMYDGICTLEYYHRAATYIREREPEATFHVFSDDIEWCAENLDIDGAVYERPPARREWPAVYDMCLMSHCRHNIIANSSYSWWAAWLNAHPEKIVICPPRWDNTRTVEGNTDFIQAKGWIVIDGTPQQDTPQNNAQTQE